MIWLPGSNTLAANVPMLYEGGEIDAHLVSLAQMTNSCTTVQLRNAAPLLYSICWQIQGDTTTNSFDSESFQYEDGSIKFNADVSLGHGVS